MIIECPKCKKNFEVDNSLIPETGRKIQCGSCDYIWFYKYENINEEYKDKAENDNFSIKQTFIPTNDSAELSKRTVDLTKRNKKKNNSLSFSKVLSYLLVFLISFVALIILLDTFKTPLDSIFPNLELRLFHLYETLKDIILFTKNLFI